MAMQPSAPRLTTTTDASRDNTSKSRSPTKASASSLLQKRMSTRVLGVASSALSERDGDGEIVMIFFGGADTHFAFGSPSLGASRAQISSLLLLTSSKLARSTDLVAF